MTTTTTRPEATKRKRPFAATIVRARVMSLAVKQLPDGRYTVQARVVTPLGAELVVAAEGLLYMPILSGTDEQQVDMALVMTPGYDGSGERG